MAIWSFLKIVVLIVLIQGSQVVNENYAISENRYIEDPVVNELRVLAQHALEDGRRKALNEYNLNDNQITVSSIYKDSEGNAYKVLEPLGRGARGQVMKAVDLNNGNLVAIKTFRVTFRESIMREFRFNKQFGLCYGSGIIKRGFKKPWLVTKFYNGPTLEALKAFGLSQLQRQYLEYGAIEELRVLHSRSVFHDDAYAVNFIFDIDSGRVRIIDFGKAFVGVPNLENIENDINTFLNDFREQPKS